jgi:hypothetical protein
VQEKLLPLTEKCRTSKFTLGSEAVRPGSGGHILITEISHFFHKICRSSTKYVVHPKIIAFFTLFSHNKNKKGEMQENEKRKY